MVCKHFAGNVVDEGAPPEERKRTTGLPKFHGPLMGTCTPCKIGGGR
jgi:hypothetical protein